MADVQTLRARADALKARLLDLLSGIRRDQVAAPLPAERCVHRPAKICADSFGCGLRGCAVRLEETRDADRPCRHDAAKLCDFPRSCDGLGRCIVAPKVEP